MLTMYNDLRLAARTLLKRPGLSVTAVVALALGIGLTTSMFSIVYGLMFRGLPYDEPEAIVAISRTRPAQNLQSIPVTIHDFEDWRDQQTSFERLAAFVSITVNASDGKGQPVHYFGTRTNADLFDLLRVQPSMGRVFRPEEDRPSTPPVMLLSHRAWLDGFDGDPEVVGRIVRANSELTTIIGVMPKDFDFPGIGDIWMPLRIDPLEFPRGSGPDLGNTSLQAIGRLKTGVSIEQAQSEMTAIAGRLATAYPQSNVGIGVLVEPFLDTFLGSDLPLLLYTMLGAVFSVLLIACGNVANLLLVRTVQRTKEVAIRTSLGSGRMRTVFQVLAEAFVLAVVGAALGLGVAKVGIEFFNRALGAAFSAQAEAAQAPVWLEAALDPAVVAFVIGLAFVATLFAGVVPALRASRTNVSELLNDESRGSSGVRLGRISHGLVVAEIALSCALLVAAGLMIRTVTNMSQFDYGYETDHVFTARLGLLEGDYPTAQDKQRFYDELLRRLDSQPGIRSASLTSNLPATGGNMQQLSVGGAAYATELDHPRVRQVVVSPTYFDTLEAAPIRGRVFDSTDTPDTAQVVIVNEQFVELYFQDGDPVGRQIRLGRAEEPWRTVVGVVPDLNMGGIGGGGGSPQHEGVYVPLAQDVPSYVNIFMRSRQDPMTLTSAVQASIHALDPMLPLYWVRSLSEQYALNRMFFEIFGTLFTAFGVAALLLATIGLYGVMSFSASSRTREIGVRMALGAHSQNILMLILRRGALHLTIGLVVGLGLAGALSQGLQALLFDINPWEDMLIFVTVVVTLSLAGIAACFVPARRAAHVSPVEALRYE